MQVAIAAAANQTPTTPPRNSLKAHRLFAFIRTSVASIRPAGNTRARQRNTQPHYHHHLSDRQTETITQKAAHAKAKLHEKKQDEASINPSKRTPSDRGKKKRLSFRSSPHLEILDAHVAPRAPIPHPAVAAAAACRRRRVRC